LFVPIYVLQVDELYSVPEVGAVVGGTLSHGTIAEKDRLVIGPTAEGRFLPVTVTTIQRNRAPCRIVRAGQAASLSLDDVPKDTIRKVRLIFLNLDPFSNYFCFASFQTCFGFLGVVVVKCFTV